LEVEEESMLGLDMHDAVMNEVETVPKLQWQGRG
jgi:hypothetical protein